MNRIQVAYNERRQHLDALVNRNDPELAERLGVRVVEERDVVADKRETRHCHWYSFKEFPGHWMDYVVALPFVLYPPGFRKAESLEEATLVLYYDSAKKNEGVLPLMAEGRLVHSGRVHNSVVTSKFTFGSVYEHRVDDVPATYGDQAVLLQSLTEQERAKDMGRVLEMRWHEGGI